ncbi:hypothetical protein C6499_14780 [Candidatus Poribacteria bacterium]|nr:MAG: hypothetical protein C6499_14780 [Candidatus Poribacteria bacterium]
MLKKHPIKNRLQGNLGLFWPHAAINIVKKSAETPKQYAEMPKQKHPKQIPKQIPYRVWGTETVVVY